MKYLLDSNIIIYHLNGQSTATDFIAENNVRCAISQITFVEVLSFDYTEEEISQVRELLDQFTVLDTNKAVAIQCLKNRKIKKIKIPDNFIASTAQVNDLILVTRNVEDFKQLDVQLLNIFD
ncbi:MAG: type II toxin-antitoxin system VapC family toxin [Desulfobacterales bacterium]|nr:type II toxin-antitoxin system VapC family toxin [Desulfobacterales bacterium]